MSMKSDWGGCGVPGLDLKRKGPISIAFPSGPNVQITPDSSWVANMQNGDLSSAPTRLTLDLNQTHSTSPENERVIIDLLGLICSLGQSGPSITSPLLGGKFLRETMAICVFVIDPAGEPFGGIPQSDTPFPEHTLSKEPMHRFSDCSI